MVSPPGPSAAGAPSAAPGRLRALPIVAYPDRDNPHMNWRVTRLGWLLAAVVLAVPLVYITFFGSVGNSCGAFDSGPNPGAEERFCGYGSDEPTDYSALFVFVNFIPAIPVLIGGLLASAGLPRRFFPLGVGVGVVAAFLIWALEP